MAPPAAPVARVATAPAAAPEEALQALVRAYAAQSVVALDALFTADYRFHTPGERPAARPPETFDRDHELRAAAEMFRASADGGRATMSSVRDLALHLDGLVSGVDPEHADSTDHYRVVAVQRFALDIRLPGEQVLRTKPALNAFHLVRGDAAVLAAGQPADSTRWYIRRWLEDLDRLALALGRVEGDCALPARRAPPPDTLWVVDEEALAADSTRATADSAAIPDSGTASADSAATPPDTTSIPVPVPVPLRAAPPSQPAVPPQPAVPLRGVLGTEPTSPATLVVEPLGSPSCSTLDLRCDLPGPEPASLDVYDAMGRLARHLELVILAPGTLRLQAGAAAPLAPGAYWVRLGQGDRHDTRLVVVAR